MSPPRRNFLPLAMAWDGDRVARVAAVSTARTTEPGPTLDEAAAPA
jgi:hypothetical protein